MRKKKKSKIISNNKNVIIMNYCDTAHAWYDIDDNKI